MQALRRIAPLTVLACLATGAAAASVISRWRAAQRVTAASAIVPERLTQKVNWSELAAGFDVPSPQRAVVPFADWQCPYSRAARRALMKLSDDSRGGVALIVRNFPVSSGSSTAAGAYACASTAGAKDRLLEELSSHLRKGTAEVVNDFASELAEGDRSRFLDCMRSPTTLRRIAEDSALAASLGARFSPTIIVGQFRFDGLPGLDAIDTLLPVSAGKQ